MADKDFYKLKNISERDRKQMERAKEMLGPEPGKKGIMKNYFWGKIREDLLWPYPETDRDEETRCEALLEKLDKYLREDHPHFEIDQSQKIPAWVITRLFSLGVMGMIIPREYGGGGFGITSYNRVLQRIGRTCGSTAVMVSAHQSIGCGALKIFGSEEQKKKFLPRMATDTLSAFCLSEPNVGCDAAGQETEYEESEDGRYYILNGEKKWATSAAMAGLFTVVANKKTVDPKTGKSKDLITAFICTPEMEGIEIFSRNRGKCGIRGTWQARIRFTGVKVPKENLLHEEGKGLKVALTCLDYGRCTLAAGMLGAASFAREQAVKWAGTRYQFDRPLVDFDLIKNKIAAMTAYAYAMDAVLYMTTGILDKKEEDIMLETAACKVFCSEMGFRTVDQALQIMGGEGYMTENVVERLWRDSRIHLIVEGANEVMHSFIFAYGFKQLGEWLLEIQSNPLKHIQEVVRLAPRLFLNIRPPIPRVTGLHPRLTPFRERVERYVRDLNVHLLRLVKRHRESLFTKQMIQYGLSWAALWIHAMLCSLSKADRSLRRNLENKAALEEEMHIVAHLASMAEEEIEGAFQRLGRDTHSTLSAAAEAAVREVDRLPMEDYVIPEKTPVLSVRGRGKQPDQTHIPQFGSGFVEEEKGGERS